MSECGEGHTSSCCTKAYTTKPTSANKTIVRIIAYWVSESVCVCVGVGSYQAHYNIKQTYNKNKYKYFQEGTETSTEANNEQHGPNDDEGNSRTC